jgi:hypothetical protein
VRVAGNTVASLAPPVTWPGRTSSLYLSYLVAFEYRLHIRPKTLFCHQKQLKRPILEDLSY